MKGKSWKRRLSVLLALVLALQVIPIRFPAAGSFLGIRDAAAAVSTEGKRGKAVIFCQTNDSVLKNGPLEDGRAMKAMLKRVDGFAEKDIHIIKVNSKSDDPRGIITEALETYLAKNDDNTYTLFYYSGHGNADSQGSSVLALSDYVEDAVHASELREWLEQYKGQFLVMLDCCYSGGMVMGASTMSARTMALDYEESEEEWEEDPEEEMEEESLAEEFSMNFVAEFMEVPTGPAIDTEAEDLLSEEPSYGKPPVEATPSEATPSEATPSEATPLEATPSEATPSEAASSKATPSEASPSEATPSDADWDEEDAEWEDDEPLWQTMSLRSRNSGYTSRFRIITAASREETASQNSMDAGELTQAVGHALGYDRYIGAYNVCAADVDKDHKVSMEELSSYVGKQPMDSQPVFYPENDTAALFTYAGAGELTPAEFNAELVEPPVLGADGKASIKVKLKNLSSNVTNFDVGVYTRLIRGYQILPIVSHFLREFKQDGTNCFRTVGYNGSCTLSLDGFNNWEDSLEVDIPYASGNPYYYLRINPISGNENPWDDPEDYVPSSYQLFKFVLEPDAAMDPNAVTFRSPWMAQEYRQAQTLYMKAEGSEDRNILPIILQFDKEPVGQNKRGEAACRVTLKVLDSSDQVVSVLAENHRPVYNWFDSSDTTFRHSTYTAYWDYTYGSGAYDPSLIGTPVPTVTGDIGGAFYKLQATVMYDDTRLGVKTVFTNIFLMESGSSKRVIYEYTPFRTCTLEAGSGSYALSDFHTQLLAMLEKGHIKDMESRALTYEIRSWDCGEDGVISGEEAAESSLPMERGRTYTVRITSKINEEDDAVFSKDCVVHAAGHPVRNVEVASDGKSITFEVVHRVPRSEGLDADDVTLNTEGKLKPGGIIKSASVTGFGEEASFFIYCDGEVYELSEDGWEIPEGCRSFEFWVVLEEEDDYKIYTVEYVLGSSLTVEGGRITGENAQFSDNLLPGEKITVEAEIPYGKWFYQWEITEYPWGDDVEAEEGYIPQSAAIDSLYSAKAVLTMGDKDVYIKAIYMDPDSHEDSDRHERQSSPGIRARRDGSWSLDPDGTWSYRVGSEKATGWQYAYYSGGPAWFSFNEKGQMETGWKQDNTYWYYLDPELGTMKTGWVQINGKWYYFNPVSGTIPWGAMYRSSRTPDGYQVGEDGAWDGAEKIS